MLITIIPEIQEIASNCQDDEKGPSESGLTRDNMMGLCALKTESNGMDNRPREDISGHAFN